MLIWLHIFHFFIILINAIRWLYIFRNILLFSWNEMAIWIFLQNQTLIIRDITYRQFFRFETGYQNDEILNLLPYNMIIWMWHFFSFCRVNRKIDSHSFIDSLDIHFVIVDSWIFKKFSTKFSVNHKCKMFAVKASFNGCQKKPMNKHFLILSCQISAVLYLRHKMLSCIFFIS